jgi:hypothetical protein
LLSSFLGRLVCRFVAWHPDMCWDPSEFDFPSFTSDLVQGLDGLGKNILTRFVLSAVSHVKACLV